MILPMTSGMTENGMINRLHFRLKVLMRRFGLVTALILAILVSLILSVGLWRSPGRDLKNASDADATKQVVAAKSVTGLYDLDQLVYNQKDGQYMVVDYRPTTTKMIKRLADWQMTFDKKERLSNKGYLKALAQTNTMVMAFPDAVAGNIVDDMLSGDLDLPTNAEISRIRVPMGDANTVVFFDDKKRIIYRYKVTSAAKTMASFKMSSETVPVAYRLNGKHLLTDTLSDVSLRSYSYLMETNGTNNYLSSLFAGTTTPSATRKGDILTYNDGSSRQMTLNTNSGVVHFDAYDVDNVGGDFNERMRMGYDWLVRIHQIPDNIYFFESHDMGRNLTYRLYVNGLPIYNQTTYGTVQIKQHDVRHEEIDFSQYSLQVPLPADNDSRATLSDSAAVYKQLADIGISKKQVVDLAYGYRWVSDTTENVVTLQPEWYFEVGDKWQAVKDAIADAQQEGDD